MTAVDRSWTVDLEIVSGIGMVATASDWCQPRIKAGDQEPDSEVEILLQPPGPLGGLVIDCDRKPVVGMPISCEAKVLDQGDRSLLGADDKPWRLLPADVGNLDSIRTSALVGLQP